MIRIDLSSDPQRWQDITLMDEDGEAHAVRIRYALLDLDQVARYRREQMALALQGAGMQASDADSQARQRFLEALLARLSPEDLAERRALLADRLRGWELADAAGAPLPCDGSTVAAVLRRADLFAPLWDGLLEASEGAGKKSAQSGSAGGRTSSSSG